MGHTIIYMFLILAVSTGQIFTKDNEPIELHRRFITDSMDEGQSAETQPIDIPWTAAVLPSPAPNQLLFPSAIFSLLQSSSVYRGQYGRRPERRNTANGSTFDSGRPSLTSTKYAHRRFIEDSMDEDQSAETQSMNVPWEAAVLPSPAPNMLLFPSASIFKRSEFGKSENERELDQLGGNNLYRLPYNRYEREAGGDDVTESRVSRLKKRALDTLGTMQIHGYKRGFDSLGGTNLHGGYKRFLSSLGGSQIHDYKRFDSLGGNNLHAFNGKRFVSSLGGQNIYDYKRTLSSLGGVNLHSGYKRYLSSLGGGHIYDYKKRGLDSLGGTHLYGGYSKRYLSSLGGTNIHGGGAKRALSSLGGTNLHGYKRALSSLGGSEIYDFKRDQMDDDDIDAELDAEKRQVDSLEGIDVHRYKRSNDQTKMDMDKETDHNAV